MHKVTINGKAVEIHDSFPAGEWHERFLRFDSYKTTGDFEHDTKPYLAFIKAWEFDGDPADVDSWRALDYFREYVPIINAVGELINEVTSTFPN